MSNSLKVILYAALVLLASLSGYFALTNFSQMMSHAGNRLSDLEQIEPERKPSTEVAVEAPPGTPEITTNSGGTNIVEPAVTNAALTVANGTNSTPPAAPATNLTVQNVSNAPPQTAEEVPAAPSKNGTNGGGKRGGKIGGWVGLFVLSLVGLGLLIANDVSHYFGTRALNTLYNDEGEGQQKDPEYDKAEETWANGDHLEAIRMMRDYLAKHPREQHVAIRIAEIYEKDLQNNLAAALEYEEVLKHKLPEERWGWAAIHLCNLYFRLNQEQKGYDLLRRIVNEHPACSAAEKARKRLEQIEGTAATETLPFDAPASAPPSRKAAPSAAPAPPSNLPPGFRPRK